MFEARAMPGSATTGEVRGLRTTGGWSIGHAAEGPQVRMVKVMRQIVPSLLVLEQNLVEQVDTRVRPAHRRPLPDDRHDVLDATRMHELDVSAARSLGARRSPEAQLLVSLNAGFGSDPDKLTDLVAMLADRKAKKLALAPADQTPLRMGQGYTSRRRDCDGAVGVPDYSPDVPDAIDVVWLATTGSAPVGQPQRLWHLAAPGHWEDVDVSALRF